MPGCAAHSTRAVSWNHRTFNVHVVSPTDSPRLSSCTSSTPCIAATLPSPPGALILRLYFSRAPARTPPCSMPVTTATSSRLSSSRAAPSRRAERACSTLCVSVPSIVPDEQMSTASMYLCSVFMIAAQKPRAARFAASCFARISAFFRFASSAASALASPKVYWSM